MVYTHWWSFVKYFKCQSVHLWLNNQFLSTLLCFIFLLHYLSIDYKCWISKNIMCDVPQVHASWSQYSFIFFLFLGDWIMKCHSNTEESFILVIYCLRLKKATEGISFVYWNRCSHSTNLRRFCCQLNTFRWKSGWISCKERRQPNCIVLQSTGVPLFQAFLILCLRSISIAIRWTRITFIRCK